MYPETKKQLTQECYIRSTVTYKFYKGLSYKFSEATLGCDQIEQGE